MPETDNPFADVLSRPDGETAPSPRPARHRGPGSVTIAGHFSPGCPPPAAAARRHAGPHCPVPARRGPQRTLPQARQAPHRPGVGRSPDAAGKLWTQSGRQLTVHGGAVRRKRVHCKSAYASLVDSLGTPLVRRTIGGSFRAGLWRWPRPSFSRALGQHRLGVPVRRRLKTRSVAALGASRHPPQPSACVVTSEPLNATAVTTVSTALTVPDYTGT